MTRHPIGRIVLLLALVGILCAPAWAQFGTRKITYKTFDWKVYESPHFNIHYYPETEPFLEEIVSHAESAYVKISRTLDHELRFRVPLVVYRNHGEFEQTNITLMEVTEGIGAFAEPIQNRIVLPIDLPPDKLYQLIAHELTHIFQYSLFYDGYLGRALRSNPPAWLIEGMASYLADDEDNLDRMAIRDGVVNGRLPSVKELSQVTFLTYRYGHAIFDFIEQEHGLEGLRTFLFEFRKVLMSNNIEKAVRESFGYDLDAFDRHFDRFLRRRYYPVLLEKKSPADYGEEIGLSKPGLYTFSPTISPSGELIAALGTPKLELDLMVLSAEGGKKVKNLTKGWTNRYRNLVTEVFGGKRDLSWAPAADQVAVFVRREDKWPLVIFNAVTGKRLRNIVFKDIVQCSSPAFSPDGKRVAFEGNRNGVVDIFEVDLESKEVRNLTQDDFFDANPWYSSDGKTLLYNRRIGAHWKIFTVDLSDPERKSQLTFGPSSDIQPALSRDGGTIYFSSDRGEHGVFNIYALDLASAEVRQFTDVVGGCFAPVEMAERSGDRNLVFSAFYEGTFRLYRMPLKEPEAIIPAEERFAQRTEAEPFEPPLSLRVDEPQKSDYKLKWDIEPPYVSVGVTDDGTFLSNVALGFSDLMGNHRIQVLATTVEDFANYRVRYANLKRRFNWGLSAYDERDFFLRETSSGALDRDQVNRFTGLESWLEYPLSRHYRIGTSVGAFEYARDELVLDEDTRLWFVQKATDRYGAVEVGLIGDTVRAQSFGPFQGKRFSISAWYAPHLSGDRGDDILQYRLDFRAYRQMTRRSLFAFRAASIYSAGDQQIGYGFGGTNVLRGYSFREFAGSRLAWTNLEFRFPLVDSLRFPILELAQIRGVFFLDVGAAWFDDELWFDPTTGGIRAVDPTLPIEDQEPVFFNFWNSELDTFQDARASYGVGIQLFLFGLPFNWTWARPLDYAAWNPVSGAFEKVDGGSTVQEFYIVFDF